MLVGGCSPGASLQPTPHAKVARTEVPPAPATTMATPAVGSLPTAPLEPTTMETWPDGPGVGESVEAVELVDPAGDASWMDVTDGSTVTAPRGPAPALDISGVVAWIANGSLSAEVTIDGAPPPVTRIPASIRLYVRHGERWYETPIICDPGCRRWGTYFPVPPFAFLVRWLPTRWIARFTVRLAELGGADPAPSEYGVAVEAMAYPAGFSGVASTDRAPNGFLDGPLLVVTDTP
jgi:hypothetical protein